jgi:hypothetical protein
MTSNDVAEQPPYRLLLSLYWIVPITAVAVAIDHFVLGGRFLPYGQLRNLDELVQLNLFSGLPHVVASLITFADTEYWHHYQPRLRRGFLIAAALTAVPLWLSPWLGGAFPRIILMTYSMYHTMMQQVGLTALALQQRPTPAFTVWKRLSVLIVMATAALATTKVSLPSAAFDPLAIALGLLLVLHWCALIATIREGSAEATNPRAAVWSLWANSCMNTSAYALVLLDYTFLAVLVPRLIHDASGHIVYVTHDCNRNHPAPKNLVYNWLRFTRLPPVILCPLVSVAIGTFISFSNSSYLFFYCLQVTTPYLHYYLEAFIWKRDTPHRRHVAWAY